MCLPAIGRTLRKVDIVEPIGKVDPNKPKAGIKIRTPAPAERFALKGLKFLKP